MRLTTEQIQIIREAARTVFGQGASVRLFGSRLDDAAQGGDIDLLVECAQPIEGRVEKACRMSAQIQLKLGEQKIDILVLDPTVVPQPIHEAARKNGVSL